MKAVVGLTAVAVTGLMCSTAYAQDASNGYVALAVNGGAGVVRLPTGQNGVLTSGNVNVTGGGDPLLVGPTLGLNAVASAGKAGDLDAFVGANIFAMYATAASTRTQSFSGVGTVYIPGISTPDSGSINLTTTRGTSATADGVVIATSPQGQSYNTVISAKSGPGDGMASDAGVSANPGDPSFVVAGGNTTVSGGAGKAIAYGGIADTSGSILIITGDLDGLSISTATSTVLIYGGGDITWGVSKPTDEMTIVQAYGGPSYRYMGQWNTTSVGVDMTVDIPEAASPTVHPLWIQDTLVQTALSSHYFGGVVGAGISHRVSDNVSVSLGAEASAYYVASSLSGQGSVRTTGGVSPTNVASPDVTVVQDPVNVTTGSLAYAVRGQVATTFDVAENVGLTFAGTVDYLSKVARPYGGVVVNGANGNASWSSTDDTAISFGDMLAFTLTASLTGHF